MSESRKGRRLVAAGASILLATGALAATAPTVAAAGKTGGELVYVTHAEQFDHIDPARVYTGRDIAFLNTYIFRNLVMYKPVAGAAGSSLVADLATNTGVPSNSAKTWKFTLRPGITWQDGSAITCADVKYGVSRAFAQDVITDGPTYAISMLNIPEAADGSSAYKGPYKKTGQALYDTGVTCKGTTITYNLKRSVADFNYALTYPAFSPVKAKKDTGDKYDLMPFASGPYKIQKYKIGEEMVLERNTKWKKASDKVRTPYPDLVTVRFGVSEEVRDQIFLKDQLAGAVNLDGLLTQNKKAFFDKAEFKDQRLNVLDPYVTYGAINVAKVPCIEVRKALFFAVNIAANIAVIGGEEFAGEPGDNPVKPVLGVDYAKTTGNIHDPNWKKTGNPAYAKELLAQAKTKCPAVYTKATETGLTWDLPNTATWQKHSVAYKAAMDAAGIVIKFNFIPSGQYYSTILDNTKQGDISRAGWGADWANASTVLPELFGEGAFNMSNNKKDPAYPAFAALMDKGLAETNRAKQAAIWKQASQYVMDQYWMIAVSFAKQQLVWGSGVGGGAYWEPQGTFLFPALYVK